jgi:hypothetical protein
MKMGVFERCFTRRGSGVRVPQRPFGVSHDAALVMGHIWATRTSAYAEASPVQ